jgi:hypothetical protein
VLGKAPLQCSGNSGIAPGGEEGLLPALGRGKEPDPAAVLAVGAGWALTASVAKSWPGDA